MTETIERSRYHVVHWIVLLVVPLLQVATNPAVFVNPGADRAIDAWVNTGLFLSLPDLLHRFGHTYYLTRLSWLLPGYLAHLLLPPIAANYTLHLLLFYGLTAAAYVLLSRGANRHVAIICALLIGWNPAILSAVGWDYVDGPGVLFLVTTLLCLECAVDSRRGLVWAAAAGGSAVCLVVTNLTLVALLPAFGMFLLVRTGASRWRLVAALAGMATLGAAVMFLLFCGINRSLGGSWFFLAPSIQFATRMVGAANPWRTPASAFQWQRAVWLVVPVVACFGACVSLLSARSTRSRFARAIQAALLTAVVTWAMLDFNENTALLQYSYYASYLSTLALLALPVQGELAQSDTPRAQRIELCVFAGLAVAHLLFYWPGLARWMRMTETFGVTRFETTMMVMTAVTLCGGLLAVLSMQCVRPTVLRCALFFSGLWLCYAIPNHWGEATPRGAVARFELTTSAHRFIGRNLGPRSIRFWYRLPVDERPPFRSIASTFLWGWVLVNERMPQLTPEEAASLNADTRIVFLITGQREADDARTALRQFGFDYIIVTQQQFAQDSQLFTVVIADLAPVSHTS